MAIGFKSGYTGSGTWNGANIADLSNIRVNRDPNLQSAQTSDTAGKRRYAKGGDFKSGSFRIERDGPPATMVEGTTGTLVLKSDSGTEQFSGLVMIGTVDIDVAINGGALIGTNVQWFETVA